MMAHELLRQAALILTQGWSKGCDARDAAGRMVPLYVGDARAKINPEAAAFSAGGGSGTGIQHSLSAAGYLLHLSTGAGTCLS